jgi:hypothetical protein
MLFTFFNAFSYYLVISGLWGGQVKKKRWYLAQELKSFALYDQDRKLVSYLKTSAKARTQHDTCKIFFFPLTTHSLNCILCLAGSPCYESRLGKTRSLPSNERKNTRHLLAQVYL